ncbi:MAG: hypothetical protein H0X24_04120 [Ktedonobacterales bacterium]|nr:hypothetical protein [Ktedonobacterales bacterium]
MAEIVALAAGIVSVVTLISLLFIARGIDVPLLRFTLPWREGASADNRARLLMREILAPQEYQQLTRFGYLEVPSPNFDGRVYRIPGAGGLVKVYDRGCAVMELCLQPAEPLPDGDVVVMHKLMITANEQEYLQKANRFAPGIISLRYQRF